MVGFVNALAILILLAQLPHITGGGAAYALHAVGLGILYFLPRLARAVPAPLVVIVVVAGAAAYFGLTVPAVGDMGSLPDALPGLGLPSVPFNLATLVIVAPFAVTLAPTSCRATRTHFRHDNRGPCVGRVEATNAIPRYR